MTENQKRPLMGRIEGDEAEVFAGIYAGSAQVLYNLAARVLRSSEEAENALTEVFVSTWREPGGAFARGSDPTDFLIARTRDFVLRRRRARSSAPDDRPVDLDHLSKKFNARARNVETDAGRAAPASTATERALWATVTRCGSVTATVVSHMFFSGLTIRETAGILRVTAAECRSRLHGCLESIASACGMERPVRDHDGWSVYAAAHAVGALEPGDCPEYLEHLAAGCAGCESELSRFSRAAGKLSYLLPDVTMSTSLEEKIFFSLQLARVVAAGSPDDEREIHPATVTIEETPEDVAGADERETEPGISLPGSVTHGRAGTPAAGSPPRSGRRVMHRVLPAACVLAFVCGILVYTSALRDTIARQSDLIESVHSRNTDLLLKYNRLAGVSEYFEGEGLVAILEGDGAYPGLTGKIVWDTAGNSAMLQILNLPPDLGGSELEVSAIRDGKMERVVGLRPAAGDSGGVFYRFFPVDPAGTAVPREFSVAAVDEAGGSGRTTRNLMSGTIPDRRPMQGSAGRE